MVNNIEEIKKKIIIQHENDNDQLDVIFSKSHRLIVEAPAGCGKTTTMISRIAFLFASGGIPNPKHLLGLTFSVNAALNIKREIIEKLPNLLGSQKKHVKINEKTTITNYHGFCKGVLKKYGYLLSEHLRKDVNVFRAYGDSEIVKQKTLSLNADDNKKLKAMENFIKNAQMPDLDIIYDYNKIIAEKLLEKEHITHNAIILFVLELFNRFPKVKNFYQSYYPLIVVDEFQYTNCIAWELLETIITDKTQLLFLGDPLQRIYGFIGAIPNIMTISAEKYDLVKAVLSKNYRFSGNPEMLKLDKNIRENAASCFSKTILNNDVAKLPLLWAKSQHHEAQMVVAKVEELIAGGGKNIAILFRQRGNIVDIIEEQLKNKNIEYFYGMFKDTDPDYVEFHKKCQGVFVKQFGKSKNINRKSLSSFCHEIEKTYEKKSETINSLICSLNALVEKISIDFSDLLPGNKYNLILDIFENRQLKQSMGYTDSDYVEFHKKCQGVFVKQFGESKNINRKSLSSFCHEIEKTYEKKSKTVNSLICLLNALFKKISIDFSDLLPDNKYNLILDVFENRQLKQSMDYLDSQVILSTIHGAKGLEWDYVILADMRRFGFPSFNTCVQCPNKFYSSNDCFCSSSRLSDSFRKIALDELSVFYVGTTRARKQVLVSASSTYLDNKGNQRYGYLSCFLNIEGIKLVDATKYSFNNEC